MKLGIIGAMDLEVNALKSSMTQVTTLKKQAWSFGKEIFGVCLP